MSRTKLFPLVAFVGVVVAVVMAGFIAANHFCPHRMEDDDLMPPGPLQWFKGNLHTHTLWSDGNDFPEMVCEWYKSRGYNFLELTDHNTLSNGRKWLNVEELGKRGASKALDRYRQRFGNEWVRTRQWSGKTQVRLMPLEVFRTLFEEPGKFLLLQGEEITDQFEDLPIHLTASNIHDMIQPQGGGNVHEVIANDLDAIQQQSQQTGSPILGHLNHPNFGYGVTVEDLAAVPQERFFEVYNGHPNVNQRGDQTHPGVERMWDIANTIRIDAMKCPPLFGLAVDDSHNYFNNDYVHNASPGHGWIMVHANRLTPKALIEAITKGEFYASSGVTFRTIQVSPNNDVLALEIATKSGVTYVTEFVGTRKGYDRRSEVVTNVDGTPVATSRRYSTDVGQVFATVEGPHPSYKLAGDELYVRAVVTASEPPISPSYPGQRQQAWTQPIGWNKWVVAGGATPMNSKK